jgi:PhnB protein
MNNLACYLNFPGTAEEAITFYAKVLKGTIGAMMRFAGSPMEKHTSPERLQKIMHARLDWNGQMLMASDAPDEYFKPMQGMSVAINMTDVAEAERIYAELSKDAKSIDMAMQETFWAQRFAVFTDRFGTPWLINCGPK